MDHAIVEEARAAWRALEAAPDAARIVDLARLALGPLATVEREGGDMVGTDAYEVLRDGWPALRGWLAHPDAAVRAAAAYALAFLLEPADQTLPALAQAAATEPDPRQQAALILAAGRLRASVQAQQGTSPDVPFEGIRVDPAVRGPEVDPVVRGATALAQTFGLPSFPRSCQPDVAAAIEALAGPVGPWGGGDVATLAAAVRAGLWVQEAKPEREVAEVVFRSDNMIATLTPAGADDEEDEADAAEDAEEEGAEEEEEEEDADEDDDDARERPTPRVQLAGLHDVEWGALEHGERGWTTVREMPGASILHPVFVRIRDDKSVNPTDIRVAQVLERCLIENLGKRAERVVLPPSALVRREVYTKEAKGQKSVRKLVVWQTNKNTLDRSYPAFVVHWTDFSPGRKEPLQREVRVAPSLGEAQRIADEIIAENVKKGWDRHA